MRAIVKKRLFPTIIILAMVLGLVGCGKGTADTKTDNTKTEGTTQKTLSDYVYLAEDLEGFISEEGSSMGNIQYVDGKIYYITYTLDTGLGEYVPAMKCYDVESHTTTDTAMPVEGDSEYISAYAFDKDGAMHAVITTYNDEDGTNSSVLKMIKDGEEVYSKEIRKEMADIEDDYFYISGLRVLDAGMTALYSESTILFFDTNGDYVGKYSANNYIMTECITPEGDLAIVNYTDDFSKTQILVIDAEKKNVKNTIPLTEVRYTQGITAGIDGRYCLRDENSAYALDPESGVTEKLFDWLDIDVAGNYVQNMFQLNSGDFMIIGYDYDNETAICSKLVKTERSAVPQKTELVVGVPWTDSSLTSSLIAFNKQSDKYHVTIRNFENEYAGNDNLNVTDIMTRALTEEDCPDLMDLQYVDLASAADKGAFVDLNQYLNSSNEINKDMFVESLLRAYTVDEKLMGIPLRFYVNTVVGRSDILGEKEGWTVEDVLTLIKNNPDKKIMLYDQRDYVMNFFCPFLLERYVDTENKTCSFNDDSFKSFLQVMATFPEKFDDDSIDYDSYASYYRNGDVMIEEVYISDFEELQMYEALMGGKITAIGFPTADGTPTAQLNAAQCYGISSKSADPEGAWEVIRYLCTHDMSRYSYAFSSLKADLEKQIAEATKADYVTDENGELVLDDEGNPIQESYRSVSWGDFTYDYRPATQEEVDQIKYIIDVARIAPSFNNDLLKIIEEEAGAFYAGQKSIDDVCNTIQSRVSIYLMENS